MYFEQVRDALRADAAPPSVDDRRAERKVG
jgi:hypothetical protein